MLNFLLACSVGAKAAVVQFLPGNELNFRTIDIPATISVARDTPNGTVIFESPRLDLYPINSTVRCLADCRSGVKNNVGDTTPGSELFPIGNTGVSWRYYNHRTESFTLGYPAVVNRPNEYGFNRSSLSIQLVKTGDIHGGVKIPAGILGYRQYEEIYALGIKINGSVITPMSCETPDVRVEMGTDYKLSDFEYSAGIARKVHFNIRLIGCPSSIKNVNYTLKANTQPVDTSRGVVSLNASSTAKGIALQLFDTNDNPIPLEIPQKFADYNSSGGDFQIPLSASYYRLPSESLEAGTANTEVTFIMTYL
ncbi:fimbrial protein [Pseudomonas sp. EMN2]|uniref:fimbrial protein n=1 Tax=Pseudomonas sp. EMN2 TaxID=2615212 RepID=UPI0015B6BBC2|nr:fimbrial protein [Pseudomonas sp. EMN2]